MKSPCYRFTSHPVADKVHHDLKLYIFGGWWAIGKTTLPDVDPDEVEKILWDYACIRIRVGPKGEMPGLPQDWNS